MSCRPRFARLTSNINSITCTTGSIISAVANSVAFTSTLLRTGNTQREPNPWLVALRKPSLYHLAEALCRWIAPILSFTAEEIWENVPGDRLSSVFLAEWYEHLPRPASESAGNNVLDSAFWNQMMSVRQQVNKALELQRAEGVLRGSLDASVTLYADTALAEQLRALGDELRFVLITSEVTVADWGSAPQTAMAAEGLALRIVAEPASSDKCERCWHRRPDVGEHATHPTLCGRCVSNIEGPGEVRQFA
jgi:isoleucyl-tRNA synthetase